MGIEFGEIKMSFERIAVRYTVDTIEDIHLNWFKMSGAKLIVKEGGEDKKDHFHFYVEGNLNTWKSYFKRHIKGGNAVYSVKKCDDEFYNYLKYLCKGESEEAEPRILFSDGYDIKQLHDQYYECQRQFKADLKQNLKKRKRVHNVLDECWEFVQEHCTESADPTQIGCTIVRWYRENNLRLPLSHAMHSLIITYMDRFNCTALVKIDERDMFRRMYPNLNL